MKAKLEKYQMRDARCKDAGCGMQVAASLCSGVLSQRCYGLSELMISLPLTFTQISIRSLSPDAAYVKCSLRI
ncbi:MAG: hypothetical protein WCO02_16795 [Bacteroidota bacterium]